MTSIAAPRVPGSDSAIRVVICDPEQLFREGLRLILSGAGLEIRHAASCLSEWHGEADIVIWGVGGMTDISAKLAQLQAMRARYPTMRFVVVVGTASAQLVRQLATAGADAVLSRDISGNVLHRALDLVMLGQQLFPAAVLEVSDEPAPARPSLTVNPVPGTPGTPLLEDVPELRSHLPFSGREAQILRCLVNGSSNKLIARELAITEATVKVHIKGLLRKIGASNRTQAAIWSLANGFSAVPQPAA